MTTLEVVVVAGGHGAEPLDCTMVHCSDCEAVDYDERCATMTRGAYGRPAPPVYGERGACPGIAERYPVSAAYNYQAAPSQQGYDQRSYYYPQDERVTAATAYNPTQAGYGGYTTHQPYM